MKITPYRTTENTVDGVVISFGDITDQKRTQWELERLSREKERQREIIRAVFDMNEQPLTVLDYEGRIFIANKSFSQWFGKDIKSLEGDVFFELVSRSVGKSLKDQLKELMDKRSNFKIGPFRDRTLEIETEFIVTGTILPADHVHDYRILLQIQALEEKKGKRYEHSK